MFSLSFSVGTTSDTTGSIDTRDRGRYDQRSRGRGDNLSGFSCIGGLLPILSLCPITSTAYAPEMGYTSHHVKEENRTKMRGNCVVSILLLCLLTPASAQNAADDLIKLIRANDLAALKSRFDAGAKVDTADARGTTLLMHAAAIGSPEAVKLLLDAGADAKAKNELDETALMLSAGDLRKARMLIDKGADVNAKSKLGRTPLIVAAACDGCSASVKLLLDKGADPKARDGHGVTALNAAADADDLETMKLLIAKGAERRSPR